MSDGQIRTDHSIRYTHENPFPARLRTEKEDGKGAEKVSGLFFGPNWPGRRGPTWVRG
jgi:hypothetical protein